MAIADGKTGYCPTAGIMPLREAFADDVARRRFAYSGLSVDDIQQGLSGLRSRIEGA